MPHFLDDRDLDRAQRLALLESTWSLKHGGRDPGRPLAGKHVALIMAKPSLRTRVSFCVALRDLGAEVIEVSAQNTKLGHGEDLQEWAAVLGRMVHGMVARVFDHADLEGLARWGQVPVVNALSDWLHPCQALADAFTVWEHARQRGAAHAATAAAFFEQPQRWAYVGDGNNVLHSLMLTAADLGVTLAVATPAEHGPDPALLADARNRHRRGPTGILFGHDPRAAVDGASVVYTDTWVSMGQEGKHAADALERRFAPFRIDTALLSHAAPHSVFMHCLPAVVGQEVSAAVLRGSASVILDQAENRLWTSKALLADHVFAHV